MADSPVAEALELISFVTQNDISNAWTAFNEPTGPIKPSMIRNAYSQFYTPEVQLQLLLMRDPIIDEPSRTRMFQHVKTYPDGTKGGIGINHPLPQKPPVPGIRESPNMESLWESASHGNLKAYQRAGAFINQVNGLDTPAQKLEILLKAAEKCGIPKSEADLLIKNGNIENPIKAAMMRLAVKSAFINGTWQNAGLTAVFEIRRLFDGDFKNYLTRVGVSGLYGGTFGALSSWVNHPFFSNGVVLGTLVRSAFGLVTLASTGDWARFGKNIGVSIFTGTTAWGGSLAGAAAAGVAFGPLGICVGTFVGSLIGGLAGRGVAQRVPGLHGKTDQEIMTAFYAINKQLKAAGMELDPNVPPREVVEQLMASGAGVGHAPTIQVRMTASMAAGVTELEQKLQHMNQQSPEGFQKFIQVLRVAKKI